MQKLNYVSCWDGEIVGQRGRFCKCLFFCKVFLRRTVVNYFHVFIHIWRFINVKKCTQDWFDWGHWGGYLGHLKVRKSIFKKASLTKYFLFCYLSIWFGIRKKTKDLFILIFSSNSSPYTNIKCSIYFILFCLYFIFYYIFNVWKK